MICSERPSTTSNFDPNRKLKLYYYPNSSTLQTENLLFLQAFQGPLKTATRISKRAKYRKRTSCLQLGPSCEVPGNGLLEAVEAAAVLGL